MTNDFRNREVEHGRKMLRLRSLASVFTKTNRILMGDRSVNVNFVGSGMAPSPNVPGWSKYPNVYINQDAFGDIKSTRTLVQLLGLNYHELSHLLFTPRRSTFNPGVPYMNAFRILEDQRIESFFTARYAPAGKYFTEMIVRFMVEDDRTWGSAFLLTYGRSYLPLEIRQEFEARFKYPQFVEEVKGLIDGYKKFRSYHFVSKQSAVYKVLRRFTEILTEMQDDAPEPEGCQSDDPGSGLVDDEAEQDAQQKERKRREKEERTGEDQSGFWEDDEEEEDDDDGSDDGGNSGEDASEDEEESDEQDDSDEGGDSGDPSEDSDEEPDVDDQQNDRESGEGDGSDDLSDSQAGGDSEGDEDSEGDGDGKPDESESEEAPLPGGSDSVFDNEELSEYLEEIIDAVNEDEVVQNEIDSIQSAISGSDLNVDVMDFGNEPHYKREIDPDVASTLNKIVLEMRRLYAEVEPGWNYGSDHGRLNVGRAMLDPENYEEMFDEWEEGREHESGVEAVLLIDLSGSMSRHDMIAEASLAIWLIKRALDEVDAKVTVLGFHSTCRALFSRNQKADRHYWPLWSQLGNDTQPVHAMRLAHSILSASAMPNKLFVIATDGGVDNVDMEASVEAGTPVTVDLEELIKDIPARKMYVGLGGAKNPELSKHCDVSSDVYSSGALVMLVKNLVTRMLVERRRRG